MNKTLLLSACLAIVVTGCAEMETKPEPAPAAKPAAAAMSPELTAAIAEAEKEIAAAKKANNIWLHTERFLDEAKTAGKEGNADEAMKLAKRAAKEAALAQKQAAAETGKVNIPK
jgi:hypothetical protein